VTATITARPPGVLADLLVSRGTAVMAHRGTPGVTAIENTARAAIAAMLSGADIVEIDVVGSTDGAFFAFHDGEEQRLLGKEIDLLALTAAEIGELTFARAITDGLSTPIETIEHVLATLWARFPTAQVNLDRSWTHWPRFLPFLDRLGRSEHVILKSPAGGRHWEHLQRHPIKYPYMGICRSMDEVELILALTDVNVIGVELLADTTDSPFLDKDALRSLHNRGAILIANAEVLVDGPNLFAGHDDDETLFGTGPGWSRLLDLGFDVIQTDWPWLLREHIAACRSMRPEPTSRQAHLA
jgi:hypothetical protein